MQPKVEEKDGQVFIALNPQLDPDLQRYSEDSVKQGSDAMKYLPLQLWANYRFQGEEDKYEHYQQYETDPLLALTQAKEILEKLNSTMEEDFSLFNRAIPGYSCSVLMRDFADKLTTEDKLFCKDIILEFATRPLGVERYHYQVSDGTEPSIICLPELLQHFPDDKEGLLLLLFLLLLNPWREISSFAIRGILHRLWTISFSDAQSLFLGYLLLKEKYDGLREEIRQENYQKHAYSGSEGQVIERFLQQYDHELEGFLSNTISFEDVEHLDGLDLETLTTAFELLPLRTTSKDHKEFLQLIFPVFSKQLLHYDYDDKVDYRIKQRFLEKFAYFILTSPKNEILLYLHSFVANFTNSREMAEFFEEFIKAEDALKQYEEFWIVWGAFYDKIIEVSKQGTYYYSKEVIRTYLLAWSYWKEDITEWHSLKEREEAFLRKWLSIWGIAQRFCTHFQKYLMTSQATILKKEFLGYTLSS